MDHSVDQDQLARRRAWVDRVNGAVAGAGATTADYLPDGTPTSQRATALLDEAEAAIAASGTENHPPPSTPPAATFPSPYGQSAAWIAPFAIPPGVTFGG